MLVGPGPDTKKRNTKSSNDNVNVNKAAEITSRAIAGTYITNTFAKRCS